jgi:hypothetical protein
MTESQIVGRCERCGREFLTMPKDRRDNYGVKRYVDREMVACRGRVMPVATVGEEADGKEG